MASQMSGHTLAGNTLNELDKIVSEIEARSGMLNLTQLHGVA